MTATTEPMPPRILTLDIVRGIAVMGILAMNIVAFAMPFQAYMNASAYGLEDRLDLLSWLVSFIFVDGKMRGLFSFLFGASMLLVIERAEAKGEAPASIHFRRMAWLLLFGLIHLYFIWFGDILALYAMVGMFAWLFRNRAPESLVKWGVALIAVQLMLFALMAFGVHFLAAQAEGGAMPADLARQWQSMEAKFGTISGAPLMEKLALFRGPYSGFIEQQLTEHAMSPLISLVMFGWETLAYFLFGMAALRTGFLTGEWERSAYRRALIGGLAVGIPAYALLAYLLIDSGFSVPMVVTVVMAATVPFRPLMIIAYAALIILLTRKGGWLVDRIAATGRAAFTNYLATSIVMTAIFYGWGLGLYGQFGRAELWLFVVPAWIAMLLWSKPWLDRYRYGPLEWLWRSLARWEIQPLRRSRSTSPA